MKRTVSFPQKPASQKMVKGRFLILEYPEDLEIESATSAAETDDSHPRVPQSDGSATRKRSFDAKRGEKKSGRFLIKDLSDDHVPDACDVADLDMKSDSPEESSVERGRKISSASAVEPPAFRPTRVDDLKLGAESDSGIGRTVFVGKDSGEEIISLHDIAMQQRKKKKSVKKRLGSLFKKRSKTLNEKLSKKLQSKRLSQVFQLTSIPIRAGRFEIRDLEEMSDVVSPRSRRRRSDGFLYENSSKEEVMKLRETSFHLISQTKDEERSAKRAKTMDGSAALKVVSSTGSDSGHSNLLKLLDDQFSAIMRENAELKAENARLKKELELLKSKSSAS